MDGVLVGVASQNPTSDAHKFTTQKSNKLVTKNQHFNLIMCNFFCLIDIIAKVVRLIPQYYD